MKTRLWNWLIERWALIVGLTLVALAHLISELFEPFNVFGLRIILKTLTTYIVICCLIEVFIVLLRDKDSRATALTQQISTAIRAAFDKSQFNPELRRKANERIRLSNQ